MGGELPLLAPQIILHWDWGDHYTSWCSSPPFYSYLLLFVRECWPKLSRSINEYIFLRLDQDRYEKVSDVPESRIWFASKNLTLCRMHWNGFLIGQFIAECHSFPNMYVIQWLRGRFDCVLPARSWEMPVKRELPANIGRCYKNLAGRNFDFRAKSSWEDFFMYIKKIL